MPFLYETVFGVSPEVSLIAEEEVPPEVFTCPVCGEEFSTEAALEEHLKTTHPWHWHFWYAPYGKPLLAFTVVFIPTLGIAGYAVSKKWRHR